MIKIKAEREGFRRCGTAFTKEWQEFPDNYFSRAEKEILKAEPMLTVEITQDRTKKETKE